MIPAVERQTGATPQDFQGRVHPPQRPAISRGCAQIAGNYIEEYNNVRLHSAIGYIAPADRLAGRHAEIFKERDRKLGEAREQRRKKRQEASAQAVSHPETTGIPLTQAA